MNSTSTKVINTSVHYGTILMIDEDAVSLGAFEENFDMRGFKFVSVRDPGETILYLKKSRPDIILIEVFMKKIRGDAIIKALRKKGLKTPIIVVSSRVDDKLKASLRDCNIADYFQKPVAFNELFNRIRIVLAVRKKALSASTTPSVKPSQQIPPSLLVITENQNIVKDPQLLVPRSLIEKQEFRILTRSDSSDSISALKNLHNNVRLIIVDASNEPRTMTMVSLLRIIVGKMQIPIFFIADSFSTRLRDTLMNSGFDSMISRTGAPSGGVGEGLKPSMIPGGSSDTSLMQQRRQIIKDLRSIKTMPPLPDIYLKIEQLAQNQNATPNDYSQVLELDPPITARLLRMSNSAHYSFKRKINSVRDAVALMGIREILSMVRLACITGNLKATPEIESVVRKIWEHSAFCAVTSRLVYERTDICKIPKLGDDLFIAGIVHDIGKIILWKFFPDAYMSFLLDYEEGRTPTSSEEEQNLGTTHCEVGKYLADYWKLPEGLMDVIAYHHKPMSSPESEMVLVTHISDFISYYVTCGGDGDAKKIGVELDNELLNKIGYTRERVVELAENLGPIAKEKAEVTTNLILG